MASTLFFVFALVASAAARPTNVSYEVVERNGLIDQNSPYILDDMLFPDWQLDEDGRNFIPYAQSRWTGRTIPYVIDSEITRYAFLILDAMEEYHAKTCIRFVQRTYETNYIRIFRGHGCFSFVGMIGGLQEVSLGEGCLYKGTIIHELGHAIGFFHEHNRSDRDEYLDIHWENIQEGMKHQFDKNRPDQEATYGTLFDYDSVMLYGELAFSKNRMNKTMTPTKSAAKMKEIYD